MTCEVCRHDAPYTQAQLERRKRELDRDPTISVYPCPDCGGTDYMLSTVNLDRPPPPTYDGMLAQPPTGTPEATVAMINRMPRGPARMKYYEQRQLGGWMVANHMLLMGGLGLLVVVIAVAVFAAVWMVVK